MNRMSELILWILIGSLLPAVAQTAPAPSDFPIGAADLLEISVLGAADFSRELRVGSSGCILMPFLGEVKVEGLTPAQASQKLAALLHPDYVVDPQVSVLIKEPRSRMFSILGAVSRPGQYQMLQSITLVTAIAGAGGLDLTRVGDTALIQRGKRGGAGQVLPATALVAAVGDQPPPGDQLEVDLRKLLLEGDMSLDIAIMPGDVISIPERKARTFFVVGDVARPGPFEFPREEGIKVSRALAMAGGPTKTAKLKETSLIRQHADGKVDRMALNVGRILKGRDPDIDLRPNDMIVVPGSVGKTFGWAMVSYLPYTLTWFLIPR